MFRRLFQRFQHGIEGVAGKLMDFVDDVDLETPAGWRIGGAIEQLRHVVDAAIRGGIELDVIDEAAAIDFHAGRADSAWRGRHPGFAIQRLGHDPRQRGLADATRAGEQIGMMQPPLLQGMGQRTHHMLLPHQGGKGFRAPFRARTW